MNLVPLEKELPQAWGGPTWALPIAYTDYVQRYRVLNAGRKKQSHRSGHRVLVGSDGAGGVRVRIHPRISLSIGHKKVIVTELHETMAKNRLNAPSSLPPSLPPYSLLLPPTDAMPRAATES